MSDGLLARGLARIHRTWGKYLFDRTAAGVFGTAPLSVRGGSPVFLTQMCHRDLAPYLLAIKSLYRAVGQGRVVIINDGSLTRHDVLTLECHIPDLEIINIATIGTRTCPRGGTWERLVKIIELSREHYIIQADADTLVSGPIPEVVQCWRANESFLLGTNSGREIAPAASSARLAQGWIADARRSARRITVGALAEAALDRLPTTAPPNYVHASSGFAGFAKGGFRLSDLETFSAWMRGQSGAQWDEWGSEQIASNYMLANAPGVKVLPFDRYACFEPHIRPGDRPFLHFIGSYRYNEGLYRKRARSFLTQLDKIAAGALTPARRLQNP
jgi:hypothetical protein